MDWFLYDNGLCHERVKEINWLITRRKLLRLLPQPVVTSSKLAIENYNKVWNMFKGNNKDTRTTSMVLFWCLYCQLSTYFTPFSSVSIVTFQHVIAGWSVYHHYDYYINNVIVLIKCFFASAIQLLLNIKKRNTTFKVRGSTFQQTLGNKITAK